MHHWLRGMDDPAQMTSDSHTLGFGLSLHLSTRLASTP